MSLARRCGHAPAGEQRRSQLGGACQHARCAPRRPSAKAAPRCRAVADVAPPPQQPGSSAAAGARDMSAALTLDNIRSSLIRQEDSIIFTLIERAQFALNRPVYEPGGVQVPAYGPDGSQLSLLEFILRETEQLHGKVRRYTSPDEHAFYPGDLPPLVLPPLEYPGILAAAAQGININGAIMQTYLDRILPAIAAPGDDGNYGSAATLDVLALQALSKRIHYGKFVAEAKFRAKPEDYSRLIRAQDSQGLMDLLTDVRVERAVVERVRLKAATFGQEVNPAAAQQQQQQQWGQQQQQQHDGQEAAYKIQPDVLAAMYDDVVMPMTKEVQVAYLLRRLDGEGAPR